MSVLVIVHSYNKKFTGKNNYCSTKNIDYFINNYISNMLDRRLGDSRIGSFGRQLIS